MLSKPTHKDANVATIQIYPADSLMLQAASLIHHRCHVMARCSGDCTAHVQQLLAQLWHLDKWSRGASYSMLKQLTTDCMSALLSADGCYEALAKLYADVA